ncbi:MAG: hypothetical protein CMN55_10780 [Sneathiella sp.]|jgi:uncharacterized protein (DUF2147 family)|uniref:DUF2147 domain-containing protein n=1 Tax=Sneathiella sp. TaxID=1964365 RepID=UPI000C534648|nr:DUF2147 domain-containing protein [Sneathiella sp.]MAL79577.1 hypothetical protein [Sneathiella sp.]|tara:strand:- start:232 stop:663 length:432 start_codon:yes stop_codon:yes gene_type:complete
MRFSILLAAVGAAFLFSADPAAAADATGIWATKDGNSHVKIAPCNDKLCGEIIWLKEPLTPEGKPKTDQHNSDETLRSRPIIGLQMLSGFVKDGESEWDDGEIYNPEDGKTYSAKMELVKPDALEVKGCVLMFCQTQDWTRVE